MNHPPRPRLGPARKLAFAGVAASFLLVLAEALMRALFGAPPPWILTNRMVREQLARVPVLPLELEETARLYREDPDCIYSLRPNAEVRARSTIDPSLDFTIRTDDRGLRTPPVRRPGLPLVLTLGDSKTFGWGVEGEETYPAVLERMLRESRRGDVPVANGGVPGHDIVQGRALLESRLLDLDPAAVICWFTGDNGGDAPVADRVLLDRLSSPPYRLAFLVTRWSWIASRIRDGWLSTEHVWAGLDRNPGAVRFTEEEFVQEVAAIQEIARGRGARLLFLDKPILEGSEGAADGRRWNEVLRSTVPRLGIDLVAVDDAFARESAMPEIQGAVLSRYVRAETAMEKNLWRGDPKSRLFVDGAGHPNAIGQGIVARLVAEALASESLPDPP